MHPQRLCRKNHNLCRCISLFLISGWFVKKVEFNVLFGITAVIPLDSYSIINNLTMFGRSFRSTFTKLSSDAKKMASKTASRFKHKGSISEIPDES